MLLFQHNNLKSSEWMGIRRELAQALRRVDEVSLARDEDGSSSPSSSLSGLRPTLADGIRLQTVQTGIFDVALRIVEFYHHRHHRPAESTTTTANDASPPDHPTFTHTLSQEAYDATARKKHAHPLSALMVGPIALLTLPTVSPPHLKAALSILAPSPPIFPAPTRRARPSYYEFPVQAGLQKLIFLGARIDRNVFDVDGARSIAAIEGGLDGLRAQLVAALQGVGAGLATTLESAPRSLYLTIQGRHRMMADEGAKDDVQGTGITV